MKSIIKKLFKIDWVLLILAAMGLAISFTNNHFSLLSWIALIPMFMVIFRHNERKHSFLKPFCFGFIFYFLLLSWLLVLYPLDWLGVEGVKGFYILVAGWLFLSAYEAFGIGLTGWLWHRLGYRSTVGLFVFAALWISMEFIQGQTYLGFTWGRLANSQYSNQLLIQSASLFGSLFISLLILLVNGFIALSLLNKDKKKHYRIIAASIFMVNLVFGMLHVSQDIKPISTTTIAIVQGNILADEKWEDNSVETILEKYVKLSKETKKYNPDILIWPETAVPVDITSSPTIKKQYERLVRELNVQFLFGGFERIDGKKYNAVTAMNSDGEIYPNSYHKQHLVPFGEFVPFKDHLLKFFPLLGDINRLDEDITPGISSSILRLPQGKVGSLICFESIFPEIARKSTKDGAEIITLVTNDSWYEDSAAIFQHNGQAVLRAVENHRTVIRAANTGISTIISPNGYIKGYIEPLTDGYLIDDVDFHNHITLYTKLGDIVVLIALIYLLSMILYKKRLS